MRKPKSRTKTAPVGKFDPLKAGRYFPICLLVALLAAATIFLYWPTIHNDFLNYDDDFLVTSNLHVRTGLTWDNIKWAFLNPVAANGTPITMLSHMLDCQLFGLKAWGHHLTSIMLHAANTVLVFLFLRTLTGSLWRSLLAAAIFGWHPLHVESVAWIAERKDVLSGFFGLLSLIFYTRYARSRSVIGKTKTKEPSGPTDSLKPPIFDYGFALFFFALGLMSKPMLVTWPFVMLLLDYWPLARFTAGSGKRLVVEKIPYFVIAIVASIITFWMQQRVGAVVTVANLPLGMRFGNAAISYCQYLGKLFWPVELAILYPLHGPWPMGQVLLAGLFVVGISIWLFRQRYRYPFLMIGWLWYGGTLVPVIGLVQVGGQEIADRYTYIPSIGILIFIIWGAYNLTRHWRHQVLVSAVVGVAAILACFGLTRHQIGYWKDSESLFRHDLEVTTNNSVAYLNLGSALDNKGKYPEAIIQFQELVRLDPNNSDGHLNLGTDLSKMGRFDEATNQIKQALQLKPNSAAAHNSLGFVLGQNHDIDEAINQFQAAIRLDPDFALPHLNLGLAFNVKGQIDDAISQFREALRLDPDHATTHYYLGILLSQKGKFDEAISHLQEAIRLKPDYPDAQNNLERVIKMKSVTSSQ